MTDETKDLFDKSNDPALSQHKDDKTAEPKPLSVIQKRLAKSAVDIDLELPDSIAYQHTILCQTCLPYRNPGMDVRRIERKNGNLFLEVDAGRALDPREGEFVDLPLPSGPKARLILCYLNAEAKRQQSPVIDVQDSLTAFVRRLSLDPKGRNINAIKRELSALSASTIRLGFIRDNHAITLKRDIITGFELWFPKNEKQRVLWSSTVVLSREYFESLMIHAVPLDERALAALSHSSMALDIYAWLAQRLHRIPKNRPQFIPWTAIRDQFGQGFGQMNNFRRKFRDALRQVYTQYPAARIEDNLRGLTLFHSLPPVPPRGTVIVNKPGDS